MCKAIHSKRWVCVKQYTVRGGCVKQYTVRGGSSAVVASWLYRLAGLVVKASASKAADPGFDSRLRRAEIYGLTCFCYLLNVMYV